MPSSSGKYSILQDEDKTKEQLIDELIEVRRRITKLEALETERVRAEEELARHTREKAALYKALLEINAQPDTSTLLQAIVRQAASLLGTHMAVFFLSKPESDTLEWVAGHNQTGDCDVGAVLSLEKGLTGHIAQTGKPMMVIDYSRWEGRTSHLSSDHIGRVLGVPLKKGDWVIGVLHVFDERTGPFDEDEIQLLSLFAAQAAIALDNARLCDEIHQRVDELTTLSEISQTITFSLDLQETLTGITDRTIRLLGVSAASVALYDEVRGDLWFAAASGEGSEFVLDRRLAMGQGVAGWAAQYGELVLVPDASQDSRFYGDFDRQSGFTTRSILCVPLQTKGQIIGAIEVMNKENGTFDEEDFRLLSALAAPAATAIENARLFDAEVRRRYEAETLREATAALVSTLDLDQVLDSILIHLEQVVPYDSACVFLQEGEWLRAVAGRGFPVPEQVIGLEHSADDLLYQQIQRTGRPLILADAQAGPRFQDWGITDYVRGWMAVPLMVRGEVTGYLSLDSRRVAAYGEAEATLTQAFAIQAAAAIQNARLFEQVRAGRERLQALSHRLVEVQEIERRHIARELHDEVGQVLTGLKLTLDMSTRLPIDAVRANLGEAQEMVNGLMAQVRELSLDLRPAMLDDLGLLPALLWHFERYTSQTGVRVTFKHTEMEGRRFAMEVETAAYRIVQEALTNVARYAGVSEATVRLWGDQDTLSVQIEDQGTGFDPEVVLAASASSGLSGMHERAVLLGGQLAVESAPEAGTRLTAELPLSTPVENRE